MKLLAGIAIGFSLLIQASDVTQPNPIFKTGSTFSFVGEFDFTKLKKQKYSSSFRITEVVRNGSHWFCSAVMTHAYDGVVRQDSYLLQFACDSLNFYVIAQNFLHRKIEEIQKNGDATSGDSLVYPLQMKVGDTLPDAWCKKQVDNAEGATVGLMEFTRRSVEALDTLNLSCGKVPAYRVVCLKVMTAKVNSGYSGKREEKDYATITEWFSPQLGIVQYREKSARSLSTVALESYSVQ